MLYLDGSSKQKRKRIFFVPQPKAKMCVIMRQGREKKATEAIFSYRQKSPFTPGWVQGAIISILCLCACRCVCIICRFTDCESRKKSIYIKPGSMDAGENGLTCGTCFVAHRLEVVAAARLLWISWCVLGGAGFFSGVSLFFFERT